MSVILVTYNHTGIKIVRPEPLEGDGGQALTDNFQLIGDHLASTGSMHSIPISGIASGTHALNYTHQNYMFNTNNAIEHVLFNLPVASGGVEMSFIVNTTHGLKVTANDVDHIWVGTISGIKGGYISSTGIGSIITLFAATTGCWYTLSQEGTWLIEV